MPNISEIKRDSFIIIFDTKHITLKSESASELAKRIKISVRLFL